MRFTELLNFKVNDPENVKRLSNMGVLSFGKGITNKNQTITPHYEIDECLKAYETMPIINSAINQLVSFIIPNKDVKISSKDEKTVKFIEQWYQDREGSLEEIKNILTTNLICGNGIVENFFAETTDGKKVYDNFFSINDMSRIYVNPDDLSGPTAFIFQLPVGVKSFKYMGVLQQPTFYNVKYIKNYTFTFQRVYGIPIPFWKYTHYKSGWCLPFTSKIETDRGLLKIGEIVKDKLQVNVKTYNIKENKFEYKPILDWLNRPYKEDMYNIFFDNSDKKGLKCTQEHPILTENGKYIRAVKLKINDKIAIKTEYLSEEQKSIIYGTLLGDGSISQHKQRRTPRLSISHSKKQKYYLDWFNNSLQSLQPNITKRFRKALSSGNKLFEQYQLSTKSSHSLIDIYNNTTINGKKKITKKFLDNITPLSLAVWIMDDGCIKLDKHKNPINIHLCTDCFDNREITLLENMLKDKFNIETTRIKHKNINRYVTRLNITKKGTDLLLKSLIKNYIIYDNGKKWIAKDLKQLQEHDVVYLPITKITKNKYKQPQTVYDLEIADNHNFITSNVIVHNSRDNLYGRSMLASSIDAVNIFQEIMSSWDTIAKTRQIDQKLISLADNETGMMLDDAQIEAIEQKLNDSDNSYNIIGLPLKILQTDISTSQGFNLMETAVDILRRQIMMSLLPQHLTPWNDSATTQGSEASMAPFLLRLKSKQNELIHFLDNLVIKELRKTYTFLAEDATHVFDEPKVMPDDYYVRQTLDMVREGIINKEQAKKYFMKMGILDEDVFESIEDKSSEVFSTSEAVKTADVGFNIFKQRLSMRYIKKPFSTSGWKQIDSDEIGGHKIRLIDSGASVYLLFDGLNLIEDLDKELIDDKKAKQHMKDYVEKIKQSFDKFITEETEEDKMFNQLEKEIEEEYKKRLDLFFSKIPKLDRKKEGFLSDKIFPSLDDVFKGFNSFIKSKVDAIVKKFNVKVIKDDDEGTIDEKTVNILKDKNDLMATTLTQNLQVVKDQQVQTIRTKLANGIAGGQDIKDIKSDIEKDMNYEKGVAYKINRAVQTSGRNATRLIKLKKLLSQGFEDVIWQTREDSKVREKHVSMNGKVFKITDVIQWITKNETPNGSNFFNCRCTFIGY